MRFYASFPLRTHEGHVIGTVCAFDSEPIELTPEKQDLLEDLAAQASTHLQLLGLASDLGTAATEDELTGVANRLILNDRLTHLLARQRRHEEVLVVAALDMERFKDINDVLGHAAGDTVLRAVARRLADSVRAEDLVARVGGDEFVVAAELAPDGISPEEFAAAARRCRQRAAGDRGRPDAQAHGDGGDRRRRAGRRGGGDARSRRRGDVRQQGRGQPRLKNSLTSATQRSRCGLEDEVPGAVDARPAREPGISRSKPVRRRDRRELVLGAPEQQRRHAQLAELARRTEPSFSKSIER